MAVQAMRPSVSAWPLWGGDAARSACRAVGVAFRLAARAACIRSCRNGRFWLGNASQGKAVFGIASVASMDAWGWRAAVILSAAEA